MNFLGIGDKASYQEPTNLSGGQQQRVAIARALMNDPKIILLTNRRNLDTKTGQGVFDLLKLLSSEFRRTIIMVTHNPELAGQQIEQST